MRRHTNSIHVFIMSVVQCLDAETYDLSLPSIIWESSNSSLWAPLIASNSSHGAHLIVCSPESSTG